MAANKVTAYTWRLGAWFASAAIWGRLKAGRPVSFPSSLKQLGAHE